MKRKKVAPKVCIIGLKKIRMDQDQKRRADGLTVIRAEKTRNLVVESANLAAVKKVKKGLNTLLAEHLSLCAVSVVNGAKSQNVVKRGKAT
jgi:hypothetical protein